MITNTNILEQLQALPEWPHTPYKIRQTLEAALASAPAQPVSRARIREVFLRNGFTIKDSQTDLKPYVYEAAEALLALVTPAQPVVMTDEREAAEREYKAKTGRPVGMADWCLYWDGWQARAALSAQPEAKAQAVPDNLREVVTMLHKAQHLQGLIRPDTLGIARETAGALVAMLAAWAEYDAPQPPIKAQAAPPRAAHPLADVICAWANGFRVEFRYRHTDHIEDSETIYLSDPKWHLCGPQYSAFSGVNEHRIHADDLDAWECFKRSASVPQPPAPSEQRKHVVTLVGVDEYGPLLEWATHWVDLPRGSKLFAEVKP